MLRWTPQVMLSSTIRELEAVRAKVAERIDAEGVASSWLFEKHAVAAGAPPEEQYLGIARDCDLYVLIVAEQQSAATECEYAEAFKDNPEKVLIFFVGDGSPDVAEFRELLQRRHTRQKTTVANLDKSISAAVLEAVTTGKIIRPALIRALDESIDVGRRLIGDLPLLLHPTVIAGTDRARAVDLLVPGSRTALTGIGGAGKSLCASICARSIAGDQRTLPIVLLPRPASTTVTPLIEAAVNAARFDAGPEVLHRWSQDGRIFAVVDALESVEGIERRKLLESIASWAKQYPRCGVVVCARRFADDELADFTHLATAPLSDQQKTDLISVLGLRLATIEFPAQVADIARWPMWFLLLIQLGPHASTGLDLLQALIDARLTTAQMNSPFEALEVRSAAGALAHRLWPGTEGDARTVTEAIEAWGQNATTRNRFSSRPAVDVINRIVRAGLVEVGATIAFPHRLLATVLASEHVASNPDLALGVDQELAPFVAGLLDDDKHAEQLGALLSSKDVFTLAKYLRLSRPVSRDSDHMLDSERLARTFQSLSGRESLAVMFGPQWVAWQPAVTSSVQVADNVEVYRAWAGEHNVPISLWPGSPLTQRTPEFLAASESVARFRLSVMAAEPSGDRFLKLRDEEVRRLLRAPDELSMVLLDRIKTRRDIQKDLAERLGLAEGYDFDVPVGEPRARVWIPRLDQALVDIEWGGSMPVVEYLRRQPEFPRTGPLEHLEILLSPDPAPAVYHELLARLERTLGCRLDSQSWGQPELIAAWAW